MEKATDEKQGQRQARGMTLEQQNKLLLLFYLLKKLNLHFKAEMFFALIKTPSSKPKELDKWAFIFASTKKLPFGLDELKALLDMLGTQLEGLPLKMEAKKVKYEGRECFAVTFEVLVKLEEQKLPDTKTIIGKALIEKVKH